MIVLSCSDISLSFGVNPILQNIGFNVQESDKVGIVGVNGAGKSTLFKIISGILQPDSGNVFLAKSYTLGYLEQSTGLDSANTIWEELKSIFQWLIEMEERLRQLEEAISKEKDEVRLSSLMKEYAALSEKYENSGGYGYNSKLKGVLKGLGFTEEQFNHKVSILSGGQKTRLALAKLLLEEPDILLMDEPTNHLDIDALEWLEDFLKGYRKCVMLISHDRYFLDAVTNKTLELENCECKMFTGNYSVYMEQKAIDREIQQKHYEVQQKEIARLEAFIEQQRRWNRERNIIAAESRQKAIDRMEKIEKPKDLPDKIKIKFRSSIISGNDVLFVENLTKHFPGKPLFTDINFKIKRNEKVFLLGPNGCGKSTLVKILAGILEKTSGTFEYGHKIKLGYYDQEQEALDESKTVIDEVWDTNEKLTQTEIRNALAVFLFKGEDIFKSISILSGGEKGRVSLVKLMLSGSNFLILDEPTNHLDINSREALEEALTGFDGTIFAISHDRYFINKLSSRILELNDSSVFDYGGNYSFYLEHRRKNSLKNESDEIKKSISKLERIADKEEKAKLRRFEKQLAGTEDEISRIEARIAQIDSEMLQESVSTDHIKLTQLHEEQASLNARLEELYQTWEALMEEKAK